MADDKPIEGIGLDIKATGEVKLDVSVDAKAAEAAGAKAGVLAGDAAIKAFKDKIAAARGKGLTFSLADKFSDALGEVLNVASTQLDEAVQTQLQAMELQLVRQLGQYKASKGPVKALERQKSLNDKIEKLINENAHGNYGALDVEYVELVAKNGELMKELVSVSFVQGAKKLSIINADYKRLIEKSKSEFSRTHVLPGIEAQLAEADKLGDELVVLSANNMAKRIVSTLEGFRKSSTKLYGWATDISEIPALTQFVTKHAPSLTNTLVDSMGKVIKDLQPIYASLLGLKGSAGQSLGSALYLLFGETIKGWHTAIHDTVNTQRVATMLLNPTLLQEGFKEIRSSAQAFIEQVLVSDINKLIDAIKSGELHRLVAAPAGTTLTRRKELLNQQGELPVVIEAVNNIADRAGKLQARYDSGKLFSTDVETGINKLAASWVGQEGLLNRSGLKANAIAMAKDVTTTIDGLVDAYGGMFKEVIAEEAKNKNFSINKAANSLSEVVTAALTQLSAGLGSRSGVDVKRLTEVFKESSILPLLESASEQATSYSDKSSRKQERLGDADDPLAKLGMSDVSLAELAKRPVETVFAINDAAAKMLDTMPGMLVKALLALLASVGYAPHTPLAGTAMPVLGLRDREIAEVNAQDIMNAMSRGGLPGLKTLSTIVGTYGQGDVTRAVNGVLPPEMARLTDTVGQLNNVIKGFDWEKVATEFLETTGYKLMRDANGNIEQTIRFGKNSGHIDAVALDEFGNGWIVEFKYYMGKKLTEILAGITPEAPARQTNAYNASVTPEVDKLIKGHLIVAPQPILDDSGELTGVIPKIHKYEKDPTYMSLFQQMLSVANGKPVEQMLDQAKNAELLAFLQSGGNIPISPADTFNPATLVQTQVATLRKHLTVFVTDALNQLNVGQLIAELANLDVNQNATSDKQKRVLEIKNAITSLSNILDKTQLEILANITAVNTALKDVSAKDLGKELGPLLTTELGKPARQSQLDWVTAKYSEAWNAADAINSSRTAQAKAGAALVDSVHKNASGGFEGNVDAGSTQRRYETPYSRDIANLAMSDELFGASFESLKGRATAAEKEIRRIVDLLAKTGGSAFLSEAQNEFNNVTQAVQKTASAVKMFNADTEKAYLDLVKMDARIKTLSSMLNDPRSAEAGGLSSAQKDDIKGKIEKLQQQRLIRSAEMTGFSGSADALKEQLYEQYGSGVLDDMLKKGQHQFNWDDPAVYDALLKDLKGQRGKQVESLFEEELKLKATIELDGSSIDTFKKSLEAALQAEKLGVPSQFTQEALQTQLSKLKASGVSSSKGTIDLLQASAYENIKDVTTGQEHRPFEAMQKNLDLANKAVQQLMVELASIGSSKGVAKLDAEFKELDQDIQQDLADLKLLDKGLKDIAKLKDFNPDNAQYNQMLKERSALISTIEGKLKNLNTLSKQYEYDPYSKGSFDNAKVSAAEKEKAELQRLKREKTELEAQMLHTNDSKVWGRAYEVSKTLEDRYGTVPPDHLKTAAQIQQQAGERSINLGSNSSNRNAKDFAGSVIDMAVWQVQWAAAQNAVFAFMGSLKAGVMAAADFDQTMQSVRWIMQANTVEAGALESSILKVTQSFKYTPKELAEGLIILGQAGFKASEGLQMLPGLAALATSTMSTLKVSTDIVTTTFEAFGLGAEDTNKTVNMLGAMTIESKLDLEKLGTTLNYVASTAATAGLGLDETGTAMGLMANAGIKASTIGTSLRSILGTLLAPSADFKNELAKVGLTANDVSPKFHDLGTIMRTLRDSGFDTERAFASLDKRIAGGMVTLMNTSDQWDVFKGKITDTNRAFSGSEKQLDSAEAQWQRFKNTMSTVGIDMFGGGITSAKEFLKILNDIGGGIGGISRLTKETGLTKVLGLAEFAAAATLAITSIKSLKRGYTELKNEAIEVVAKQGQIGAEKPTSLQKTLAAEKPVMWDTKTFGVALAAAIVYALASKSWDVITGKAKAEELTAEADVTATTRSEFQRYKLQYENAAVGSTTAYSTADSLINLAKNSKVDDERIRALMRRLTQGPSAELMDQLEAELYLKDRADSDSANTAKIHAITSQANDWWRRRKKELFSAFNLADKVVSFTDFDKAPEDFSKVALDDKDRLEGIDTTVSGLKSTNKFYMDRSAFEKYLAAKVPDSTPMAESIRMGVRAQYEEEAAKPDFLKKQAAGAKAGLYEQVTAVEMARKTVEATEAAAVGAAKGSKLEQEAVAAKKAYAELTSELKLFGDEYIKFKAEAEKNPFVNSIDNMRKSVQEQDKEFKQLAETVATYGKDDYRGMVAQEKIDALQPSFINNMKNLLVKDLFSRAGGGKEISTQFMDLTASLANVAKYGDDAMAKSAAFVPVTARAGMVDTLKKLQEEFAIKWKAAGKELQNDPNFVLSLEADIKLTHKEKLNAIRKDAAARAEKYFDEYQKVLTEQSKRRNLELEFNLEDTQAKLSKDKSDQLYELQKGPRNAAYDYGYQAGPNMYMPLSAYSKEQETMIGIANRFAEVQAAVAASTAQYNNNITRSNEELAASVDALTKAYGDVSTGKGLEELATRESRILDTSLEARQAYIKSLKSSLDSERDMRKQTADAIINLEKQRAETINKLQATTNKWTEKPEKFDINASDAKTKKMLSDLVGESLKEKPNTTMMKELGDKINEEELKKQANFSGTATQKLNQQNLSQMTVNAVNEALERANAKTGAGMTEKLETDITTKERLLKAAMAARDEDMAKKASVLEVKNGMSKEDAKLAVEAMYTKPTTVKDALGYLDKSNVVDAIATSFTSLDDQMGKLREAVDKLNTTFEKVDKDPSYQTVKDSNNPNNQVSWRGELKLVNGDGTAATLPASSFELVSQFIAGQLKNGLPA